MQILAEKIRQRRNQMLIHSYIYYELNDSIIDDETFDRWAKELYDLGYKEIGFEDKQFIGWDGSTGCHLKPDGRTRDMAERLLKRHKEIQLALSYL